MDPLTSVAIVAGATRALGSVIQSFEQNKASDSSLQIVGNSGPIHIRTHNAMHQGEDIEDIEDEIADLRIYQAIMAEISERMSTESEVVPSQAALALQRCSYRLEKLEQALLAGSKSLPPPQSYTPSEKRKISAAAKTFRRSILLLRSLLQPGTNWVINAGDSATVRVKTTSGHPLVSNGAPSSTMNNVLRINAADSAKVMYDNTSQPKSSLLQSTTSKDHVISVTIWGGVQNGESKWFGVRGLLDSAMNGNWINPEIISRAGLQDQVHRVKDHPYEYVDFHGRAVQPTQSIEITWFYNKAAKTRITTFFLAVNASPFDVSFGKEFMADLKENGTVLPLQIRPLTKKEESAAAQLRAHHKIENDRLIVAQRQRDRELREMNRSQNGVLDQSTTPVPVQALPTGSIGMQSLPIDSVVNGSGSTEQATSSTSTPSPASPAAAVLSVLAPPVATQAESESSSTTQGEVFGGKPNTAQKPRKGWLARLRLG